MAFCFKSQDELFFLNRRNSAEYVAGFRYLFKLFIGLDLGHINSAFSAFDSAVLSDVLNGLNAVAGDNLKRYSLLLKIVYGVLNVISELVLDKNKRHRL